MFIWLIYLKSKSTFDLIKYSPDTSIEDLVISNNCWSTLRNSSVRSSVIEVFSSLGTFNKRIIRFLNNTFSAKSAANYKQIIKTITKILFICKTICKFSKYTYIFLREIYSFATAIIFTLIPGFGTYCFKIWKTIF